jgi:hypothetical protein
MAAETKSAREEHGGVFLRPQPLRGYRAGKGQGLRSPSRAALPCTRRRDFGQAFRMMKLGASAKPPGGQE